MTHSLQRTALILVATTVVGSALVASPALARTHHHHHAAKKSASKSTSGASGKLITLPAERTTYVVKKGDTLEKIAGQLDTSVAELRSANKLKSDALQPGEELKGPAVARKAYVVVHGDTVFSIAKRFHVTVEALRSENGLSSKSSIHSGQQLKLPAGFKAPAGVSEAAGEEAPAKLRGHQPSTAETAFEQGGAQKGAAGRVETAPGRAVSYKVRKGDTLDKIADKLGTSVAALRRDNHIKGNTIHPGQVLKGPKSGTARVYVAASGDTLAGVAERFGVSVTALKSANGLKKRTNTIHAGQRLRLPAGSRDSGRAEVPERPAGYPRPVEPPREGQTLPARPQPYSPSGVPPKVYMPPAPGAQGATPTPAPGPSDAQVSQMGRGRFIWPLKGDLISDFGLKDGGQRNDGIDIRAGAGDAVRSAADGDVVYAGDQVPGFGNLVLIKHADGWVTAYGHLGRVDVKMQQKVTQGQQIGQAGQTGGAPENELHFEVRYAPNPLERARPVDPKLVLPK